MEYLDLTHRLHSNINVYPGTPKPVIEDVHHVKTDDFAEKKLTLYSHHGTHIDSQRHVFDEGSFLESVPLDCFFGTGIVLRVHDWAILESIHSEELLRRIPALIDADFLLIDSGWGKHWGTPIYDQYSPKVSADIIHWLVEHKKKGIGIDAHSIDSMYGLTNHRIALSGALLILENLNQVHLLPETLFHITALPLLYAEADGAPARIVAQWRT